MPVSQSSLISIKSALTKRKQPGAFVRVAAQEMPEHDPALFEQLRALRTRQAEQKNVPPYVIFHDRALTEMAIWFPRTPEEFTTIHGVGQRKVEEYAFHFMPLIEEYFQEKEIEPRNFRPNKTGNSMYRSTKSQKRTIYIWKQFQARESIASIADDLGLAQSSILYYLKKAYEAGKPLQVEGLKTASPLTKTEEGRVLAAFDECGPDYLRPVFDALEESVPYDQLHLWQLIYLVTRAA